MMFRWQNRLGIPDLYHSSRKKRKTSVYIVKEHDESIYFTFVHPQIKQSMNQMDPKTADFSLDVH